MAEVSVKNSFETLYSVSKMNDSERQVILSGSCPLLQILDVFIPAEDKLNILLLIEITSEERNHSRAGMRIRRKLSPLFAKTYDKIKSNYSIINQEDGKNFMRAEFHCYSRISGRKIYRELKKEFFK